jgi:central glycolytic genes regulator
LWGEKRPRVKKDPAVSGNSKKAGVFRMDNSLDILRTVVPEMISLLQNRYELMCAVGDNQPVGRRVLALKLESTERVIRKEANFLKEIGLLDFTSEGMLLTEAGESVILSLKTMFGHLEDMKALELELASELGIKKVILAEVPNNIITQDDESRILSAVGKMAAEYLKGIVKENSVIGLSGGSTVHSVIENFRPQKNIFKNVTVIPARGGIGVRAQFQANTLVEKLALKLGCNYQVLYTPDKLSKETIDRLKEEPQVKDILEKIEHIDTLIFGIGQAFKMAERRNLNEDAIALIKEKEAVSEAFGYYFDKDCNIVHAISTIGVELSQFDKIDNLVLVACGVEKAEAIRSISKLSPRLVLVADERVARAILNKWRSNSNES